MNERTKQLANKATRIVETTDHCSGESESHTEVDLEKFAELIVKECVGVAEVSMPVNSYPDDRLAVKNNVLKHFGVEE